MENVPLTKPLFCFQRLLYWFIKTLGKVWKFRIRWIHLWTGLRSLIRAPLVTQVGPAARNPRTKVRSFGLLQDRSEYFLDVASVLTEDGWEDFGHTKDEAYGQAEALWLEELLPILCRISKSTLSTQSRSTLWNSLFRDLLISLPDSAWVHVSGTLHQLLKYSNEMSNIMKKINWVFNLLAALILLQGYFVKWNHQHLDLGLGLCFLSCPSLVS